MGSNTGPECEGCPYQKICFGLQPGSTYQVTTVRDVVHPCALHDEGRVQVVMAEESDFATSIETKKLRGTATTWTPVPCGMPECPKYGFCHPLGPVGGRRYEVGADEGSMACPAGFELSRVRLKPMR